MTLTSSNPDSRLVEEQQPFNDPLLQSVGPDQSAQFHVLGQQLLFETNDSRIMVAAEQSFGSPQGRESEDCDFSVRILTHDLSEEENWRPIQPVLRGQGSQFYIASSRASVISGDAEEGRAFGFVSHEQVMHQEHLRSTIVQSPVLWMACQRALSAVHSACVVLDGATVMIRGISNAGKTTLAYAALREGFSLLAEDVAFVFPTDDGLELRALPWLLYLKEDAVRFFPELGSLPSVERYNGERKIPIFIKDQFPGQHVERANLGPTVFVEQNGEMASRLHPLSRADALMHLTQTRIAMERPEDKGIDVWGRLLEYPMYRFEVGTDPLEAAALLRSIAKP